MRAGRIVRGEVSAHGERVGKGVRLEYFGHNNDDNADALITLKRRYLEEHGCQVIDHELHVDPLETPKVWGWILYREARSHHGGGAQ